MIGQYRLATVADAEKVFDLTFRAYAPIREHGINFAAANADLETVKKHIQDHMCFVLEKDGKLLATITLRMPWGPLPGPAGVPHIGWFAVDPDSGNKGLGSQVLNWLEDEILRKKLKVPAVTLGTADKHPWLSEMYTRKGYEHFANKDLGKGHITLYFRKIIREDLYNKNEALQRIFNKTKKGRLT